MTQCFIALRYGAPGPTWLTALQLAEAWGQHPEDIMRRPRGLLWAARYVVYQKALAKVRKMASKK